MSFVFSVSMTTRRLAAVPKALPWGRRRRRRSCYRRRRSYYRRRRSYYRRRRSYYRRRRSYYRRRRSYYRCRYYTRRRSSYRRRYIGKKWTPGESSCSLKHFVLLSNSKTWFKCNLNEVNGTWLFVSCNKCYLRCVLIKLCFLYLAADIFEQCYGNKSWKRMAFDHNYVMKIQKFRTAG